MLYQSRQTLDTFSNYLDGRINRLMNHYGVPGVSIALVHYGKLVWSAAYGYADLERDRKMSVNTVYRVESISKSVTAWGIMKLVEQGLIDLDEPVQQYLSSWELPESKYSEQMVTVRRLLSHSAGMPLGSIGEELEYAPQSDLPSSRDYLTHEAQVIREPGSGFLYSNVGFNLLELLIEEVTGRDFKEYMAEEVLIPLGMHNSSFAWNEKLHVLMARGYDLKGKPVPPYVYPVNASGGLLAPVEDIARFVSAGMTGSYYSADVLLEEGSILQIHTREVDIPGIYGFVADSYGFGHFIETLSDGRQAIWHGGPIKLDKTGGGFLLVRIVTGWFGRTNRPN
jgi:CubicO group peptidase (beta-lactamase class C family)